MLVGRRLSEHHGGLEELGLVLDVLWLLQKSLLITLEFLLVRRFRLIGRSLGWLLRISIGLSGTVGGLTNESCLYSGHEFRRCMLLL